MPLSILSHIRTKTFHSTESKKWLTTGQLSVIVFILTNNVTIIGEGRQHVCTGG